MKFSDNIASLFCLFFGKQIKYDLKNSLWSSIKWLHQSVKREGIVPGEFTFDASLLGRCAQKHTNNVLPVAFISSYALLRLHNDVWHTLAAFLPCLVIILSSAITLASRPPPSDPHRPRTHSNERGGGMWGWGRETALSPAESLRVREGGQ